MAHELEIVMRLKDKRGRILAEYTARDDKVEIVNFWMDGSIQSHGTLTIEEFHDGIQREQTRALLREQK